MFLNLNDNLEVEDGDSEPETQDGFPFEISVQMEKAECNLQTIIDSQPGIMPFKEFYILFRDTIFGLTFMHMKNIAHRDINTLNIMKISPNQYKIKNNSKGINLTF